MTAVTADREVEPATVEKDAYVQALVNAVNEAGSEAPVRVDTTLSRKYKSLSSYTLTKMAG